jgi:hypothetical protein
LGIEIAVKKPKNNLRTFNSNIIKMVLIKWLKRVSGKAVARHVDKKWNNSNES